MRLVSVHSKMSRFPKLDSSSPRLTVQWEYCLSLSHLECGITQWHLLGQQIHNKLIHPVIQTAQMHSIILNILQILSVGACVNIQLARAYLILNCESKLLQLNFINFDLANTFK